MSKTVTLRLREEVYDKFRSHAESDNRSLANFIETSVLRYVEQIEFADEHKMAEIKDNQELNKSLKRGLRDAKARRGRFVE